MIERLHIKGFQSLADVDLELGRFTVIQGRSNSGKSAVIRALRAVVTNAGNLRGTNGSFIHRGSKSCSVTIERSDGYVTWKKSASETRYDLNGRKFKIGTDVPPDVASFLKMGDIALDADNKVNINIQGGGRNQGQFEPPFLVVDRPGSFLAKVFALLTSANVLYAAQAVAKKEGRQKAGTLKTMREVVEAERERLVSLQAEHTPLVAASTRAGELLEIHAQAVAEVARLSLLRDSLQKLDAELLAVDEQLRGVDIDLSVPLSVVDGHVAHHASYVAWNDALLAVDAELRQLDEGALQPLPESVSGLLLSLDENVARADSYTQWRQTLAGVDHQLATIEQETTALDAEREAAHAELHTLVAEIDLCPTCNQRMEVQVMTA